MARYEGMDDLLQRVRDRLGVTDAPVPAHEVDLRPASNETYEQLQARILILLHEADQLRAAVIHPETQRVDAGRREELLALLDRVQRELRRSESALERT